ncbi:MAG TPA: hypothetical protein PK869_05055 [Candidatus Hydrogenedentes bacterium]|nr:hypothetical protein [Candidatus Hydrogenedentota bacterium]
MQAFLPLTETDLEQICAWAEAGIIPHARYIEEVNYRNQQRNMKMSQLTKSQPVYATDVALTERMRDATDRLASSYYEVQSLANTLVGVMPSAEKESAAIPVPPTVIDVIEDNIRTVLDIADRIVADVKRIRDRL